MKKEEEKKVWMYVCNNSCTSELAFAICNSEEKARKTLLKEVSKDLGFGRTVSVKSITNRLEEDEYADICVDKNEIRYTEPVFEVSFSHSIQQVPILDNVVHYFYQTEY